MPKLLALCGAVLCFSLPAAAQDNPGTPTATPASTAATPARWGTSEQSRWQVGLNYNFVRFRPGPTDSFNLHGFNTTLVMFGNNWFGLEGHAGAAFGNTPDTGGPGPFTVTHIAAHLITYGGGPHLARRGANKLEPWVHVLFGGGHFRFAQTGGPSAAFTTTNAFALTGGGGVDVKLAPRIYWRIQGDFLGTRFFSTWQKSVQFQTGFVFNL